ncbi:glycoside hydrolase family 71/99-like protein [Epilithonimonas vandammei]|uniref:glycoside hydrolase family 71/99-like protein n=1 Tax=Epilithonimonas vandammei TaxID=2487072 RepID=UPI0028A9B6EB|nr:glycoside hydrolase family 71/99-like protein [Epilithonimonas vandammei]
MERRYYLLIVFTFFNIIINCQLKHSQNIQFNKFDKMLMVGYQGWFAAPADGANIGWYKYAKDWKFDNSVSKFDLWPDVKEYKKVYKTPVTNLDGSATYLFSSNDESTVDLHLKWMKDYSIDGLFVQRFFLALHDATRNHHIKVLKNILKYGNQYKRAVSVMYDLSGLQYDKDADVIIEDWKFLVDSIKVTSSKGNPYLYNNGRPVVALYAAGYSGNPDTLKQFGKIINFLKNDKKYGNCTIVLGVPFYWRTLNNDARNDPKLHELIKTVDYIFPWSVGRITSNNVNEIYNLQEADLQWCKKYNVGYLPVIYPGFSWHNAINDSPLDLIPREGGAFYKSLINNVKKLKVRNVYVAMFDEIDEGTAIFKISKTPPQTKTMKFVPLDKNLSEDYYLKLSGDLANFFKKYN